MFYALDASGPDDSDDGGAENWGEGGKGVRVGGEQGEGEGDVLKGHGKGAGCNGGKNDDILLEENEREKGGGHHRERRGRRER